MKAGRIRFTVLTLLGAAVIQLSAQEGEADRKLLGELRVKAWNDDARSQFALGMAFGSGNLGLTKNEVEAVKWFRKAAEQNLAEAQCNLGVCYRDGQGVAPNYVEAATWFRKAAGQNDAAAQYNLGICYRNGQGVARDYGEAAKWFRQAAGQNLA